MRVPAFLCLLLTACGTVRPCVTRAVEEAVAAPLADRRFAGVAAAAQGVRDAACAGDAIHDHVGVEAVHSGAGPAPRRARCAAAGGSASLGYGWFLRRSDAGRALQYHAGSGAGFRAFNYRLPQERMSVIVLSNIAESEVPWVLPLVDRVAACQRP